MEQIFFGGWSSLVRTLIVGVLTYVVLVVFLCISGNRTLCPGDRWFTECWVLLNLRNTLVLSPAPHR